MGIYVCDAGRFIYFLRYSMFMSMNKSSIFRLSSLIIYNLSAFWGFLIIVSYFFLIFVYCFRISAPSSTFFFQDVTRGGVIKLNNALATCNTFYYIENCFSFFSNNSAKSKKYQKQFLFNLAKHDDLNNGENNNEEEGRESSRLANIPNDDNTKENEEAKDSQYLSPLGINWEKAWSILEESKDVGVDPQVVAYNAVLSAYERHGLFEDGLKTLQEMHKQNIKPDRVSYTLVMSACEKAHMLDQLMEVYKEMKRNLNNDFANIKNEPQLAALQSQISAARNENIHPDKNVYEILLNCCNKEGKGKKALEIFEEMKKDLTIKKISYAAFANVISACENEGMYDSVLKYFNEMQRKSIPLSRYVINKVLSVYDKLNMADEALSLYKKMKNELNISGDINTYNYLLNVFANSFCIDNMENIWVELLCAKGVGENHENGGIVRSDEDDEVIFPNLKSYEACLKGYALTSNAEKATILINEMIDNKIYVKNNLVAFHLALSACIENGESGIAFNILRKMQQHQVKLSVHTYNLVMKSCLASENWKLILSLFYEMMTKYINSNKEESSTNNVDAANGVDNKSTSVSLKPSLSFYAMSTDKCVALSLGLKALCKLCMLNEAKQLIKVILAEKNFATSPILKKTIDLCNKQISRENTLKNTDCDQTSGKINNKNGNERSTSLVNENQNGSNLSFSPFSLFIPHKHSKDEKLDQNISDGWSEQKFSAAEKQRFISQDNDKEGSDTASIFFGGKS